MVYVIQVCWQLASSIRTVLVPSRSCSQAVSKPVWHILLLCVKWKTPDDWQRNCPKHVEFYSKNKFEKFLHLVGLIIRILLVRPTLRKETHIISHYLGKDHLNAVNLWTTPGYPNSFPSLLSRQKILCVFLGSPPCLSLCHLPQNSPCSFISVARVLMLMLNSVNVHSVL